MKFTEQNPAWSLERIRATCKKSLERTFNLIRDTRGQEELPCIFFVWKRRFGHLIRGC